MKTFLIIVTAMLPVMAATKRTAAKDSAALGTCQQNLTKCRSEVNKLNESYSITELAIEEVRARAPKPNPQSTDRTPETDTLAEKARALEQKYANKR